MSRRVVTHHEVSRVLVEYRPEGGVVCVHVEEDDGTMVVYPAAISVAAPVAEEYAYYDYFHLKTGSDDLFYRIPRDRETPVEFRHDNYWKTGRILRSRAALESSGAVSIREDQVIK